MEPRELFGNDYMEFCIVDPFNPKNEVSGFISRKPNEYYGALLIEKVNNKKVRQQLVMGSPKMHYPFFSREDGSRNYRFPTAQKIEIYDKLDGTNVVAYFYYDDKDRYVTYKPRLRPFLQPGRYGDFLGMWKEVAHDFFQEIKQVMVVHQCNLSFELYGSRNPHLIIYENSLDIALLFGVTNEGKIISPAQLKFVNLPVVNMVKVVDRDYVYNYESLQQALEKTLKPEDEEHYSGTEGAVWYLHTTDNRCIQLKCLDGRTRLTTKGGTKTISSIVVSRDKAEVLTLLSNGKLGWRKVTSWYRTPIGSRGMLRVGLKHNRRCAKGFKGVNLTQDHLVLTDQGYKHAGRLTVNDLVASGEYAPNYLQSELIDGTLLGDATISENRLRFAHADIEYSQIKEQFLSSIGAKGTLVKMSKYGRHKDVWAVTLPSCIWARQQKERWYVNGKKTIPSDIILTPRTLAVWYMDDGNFSRKTIVLATNSFTLGEVKFLSNALKGIGISDPKIDKSNGVGWTIRLNQDDATVFLDIVLPYIPYSMQRKTGKDGFDKKLWNGGEPLLGYDHLVFGESSTPEYEKSVYCIDVDETHNFVTYSGIVHNCKPDTIEAIHFATGAGLGKNSIIVTCWNAFETTDAPTVDLIKQMLLEEFTQEKIDPQSELIERCLVSVMEQAEFRAKVLDEYRATGVNILTDKAGVMRKLSTKFTKHEMKAVYSIIRGYA